MSQQNIHVVVINEPPHGLLHGSVRLLGTWKWVISGGHTGSYRNMHQTSPHGSIGCRTLFRRLATWSGSLLVDEKHLSNPCQYPNISPYTLQNFSQVARLYPSLSPLPPPPPPSLSLLKTLAGAISRPHFYIKHQGGYIFPAGPCHTLST